MSLFVIILNWNGKQDTLECLKSFQAVSTPHQIVVVDNASSDQSAQIIERAFPSVTLLENRENLGYAEGNNVGIRYALKKGANYLLILNNDTRVDPSILKGFLQTMEKHPKISILGAKPFLYSDQSRLDHIGGMWNKRRGNFDLIGSYDEGDKWTELEALDYVCGCALFVKAEVFQKIGEFESRFFLFWEESDWCSRARKAGFQPFFCPEAKIWHKVSASFIGGKAHTTYFWWRNRLFWIERNCSKSEQVSLFFRVLFPEISHLFKLYLLKSIQLFFLKCFTRSSHYEKKMRHLHSYRAALTGVKDYLVRRFGNGPSWIFKK